MSSRLEAPSPLMPAHDPSAIPADSTTPWRWSLPPWLVQIGGMAHLTYLTVRRGCGAPFTWQSEFAEQFGNLVRTCLLPVVLVAFVLSFGPVGVQASGFLSTFGAYDRFGSVYELVDLRVFAPMVVAIVLAGAASPAICADLGARVVREEIDALSVLGVDPIKSLVVPRVLAVVIVSVPLMVVGLCAGLLGGVLVLVQHGQPVGPAVANFLANATALEMQASTVKVLIYAAIFAIVACFKGLNVSGGAEGVGRAVNHVVVIAFLAIGFIDYVFSQLLLATHPQLSQVRG